MNGCSPTITSVDTSCPGYKKSGFDRNLIRPNGLSIMPVLGGAGKEEYRRPMGDELFNYLTKEFVFVKSTAEVTNSINENKLTNEYSLAITNYQTSAIVPQELIKKLGGVLGTRYLLYTTLLSDSEVATYYTGYYGSTAKLEVHELYVLCQVWDTEIGDIVWEGKGGFASAQKLPADPVLKTAEGLTKVIGNNSGDGPCDEPNDLLTAYQKAMTNTYWTIIGVSLGLSLILIAL